ncbi:MAG: S41 family peptidase, partial [Bacteroidia bacterium]|nr:S41 family peptidase [Bacteroidia bacterium]
IRTAPNEVYSLEGLEKFHDLKSGMTVKKGDTLGTLSYSYKAIQEPSLKISRSINKRPADPMTPLGLTTTFIKPVDIDPLEKKSVNDLKEDFSIFCKSLEEGHPGLYDYISKEELDHLFERTLAELKEPLNSFEFENLLNPIVRGIRDKHLFFIHDFPRNKALPDRHTTVLPIYFGWESDSLTVTRAVKNYQSYIGKTIKTINGIPALNIKQKVVENYRFEEGNVKSYYDFIFLTTWQGYLFELFPSPNMSYNFKFSDGDSLNLTGTIVTPQNADSYKTKNGPLLPNMSVFLNKQNRPCSFRLLNDSTAYLYISTFDISTVGRDSIIDFIRQINRQSIQNLVIDVRYNSGGASGILADLYALVAQKPFRLAEKHIVNATKTDSLFAKTTNLKGIRGLFDNYLKLENGKGYYLPADSLPLYYPNDSINFSGNVYILSNEHSFSAASLFAALIFKFHRGLIIGRETGNPYYQMFADDYAHVLLPHSGLILQIPLIKMIFDESPEVKIPFGRGVLPDYEIPLKMIEMVTEADPTLDKAFELIARGVRISKEPVDNPTGLQENKSKTGYLVLLLIIPGISIFAFMKCKIKK